ncbi:MAG: response regulator transcription factor [Anaerolineales bacterium]|nr:response regulator transcription factor [Anaerolineales bacterium]
MEKSKPIRVLVVDDHAIVRDGIRSLLATHPTIIVVGEAENGEGAVSAALKLKPDIILMDLVLPKMDGIEATRRIVARWPEARVLVLTSFAADDKVFPAIKAGALGYLLKDSPSEDLVRAIHALHHGESMLHPRIARKLMQELYRQDESPPVDLDEDSKEPLVELLTAREIEVLKMIAKGLTNQEIADVLCISDRTVTTHVSNILGKLHVANRIQAALYAIQMGLAEY